MIEFTGKEKNTDNYQVSLVIDQLPSSPPEAHYTVYKLTDPDGKIYIGCTGKSVEERWKKGNGYRRKDPIGRAIKEIGWENFKTEILCENLIKAGAEKLERWFIAFYDSSDPQKGYNRFLGGLGKGAHMSEVTKKLARESKNRLYEDHPELKDKIRNTVNELYGRDPTYRERIGKGVLAAYENDPTIKLRLSKISKELWQDPGYREKCSSARRAASEDPLLADRQSISRKQFYEEHPERREKIRKQMQEYLSKPENRKFVDCCSRAKPVICVETGEVYPSQLAAEKSTGYAGIHKACSGRQNTSGGYHWRILQD